MADYEWEDERNTGAIAYWGATALPSYSFSSRLGCNSGTGSSLALKMRFSQGKQIRQPMM